MSVSGERTDWTFPNILYFIFSLNLYLSLVLLSSGLNFYSFTEGGLVKDFNPCPLFYDLTELVEYWELLWVFLSNVANWTNCDIELDFFNSRVGNRCAGSIVEMIELIYSSFFQVLVFLSSSKTFAWS